MIFEINKVGEFEELRDFSVVYVKNKDKEEPTSSNPITIFVIGGLLSNGNANSIQKYNTNWEKQSIELPSELHQKLKRIGHTSTSIYHELFVIGGKNHSNSIISLNTITWEYKEMNVSQSFSHHSTIYCPMRKNFIIFDGKMFYFFNVTFHLLKQIKYENANTQLLNKYNIASDKEWLYIFGGHNGISFGKSFHRIHIESETHQPLASIPNSHFIRITGIEMHYSNGKIYFVFSLNSLSKNNFFYIYNLHTMKWENNYILKDDKESYCIQTCQENNLGFKNRSCTLQENTLNFYSVVQRNNNTSIFQSKIGNKCYGSFIYNNAIYIFYGGSFFFHYTNKIYQILLSEQNQPLPKSHFNCPKTFDFIIRIDKDNFFYCHKHVLIKFSEYFETLFLTDQHFAETFQNELVLEITSIKAIETVLQYMYEYPFFQFFSLDLKLIIEILEISQYLVIPCLVHDMESFLMQNKNLLLEFKNHKSFPFFHFSRLKHLFPKENNNT